MSNVERRYAYLDEGVFPEEGEYGVTYLTLYSSNAGNTYDGWVYDPYNKVRESLTERTYGYRNPDYPQYCWDDEVVVDLSNAQSRQESSEFIQGRITSFNTNVSSRPIVLQDIDITGLTEEERENRATTVLFCAIPLVQDAYIQAQVEVQCKCNLSPNNTSGEMRIEAFYILNDESDRTMRPNPVHTFTVSSENERHTLPWLYWNPALRHEDHNYIGVKLICTGGTAEIGISDNPDYGDAMITLGSAGMTGDRIDSGRPVSLEIFGKEEVVGGYELDPDDYTVLCTYDTGEIYEVTRMCTFNPAMGTPIEQAFTTLTAYYMGLSASMTIRLGMVESIELSGLDYFHNKLKLKLSDYTVLAYIDTGDVMDVTGECTFSPAMGTTITSDTTLTATYSPFWMHGASFTDSIDIEQLEVVATGYNDQNGLVYTLYEDNNVVITGNATHRNYMNYDVIEHEVITLPYSLDSYIRYSGYTLQWDAEGKVGGYVSRAISRGGGDYETDPYDYEYLCKGFINFEDVEITCLQETDNPEYQDSIWPYIYFSIRDERDLTSSMLKWLGNVDSSPIMEFRDRNRITELSYLFHGCRAITNVDFMANWNFSSVTKIDRMFEHCVSLKNINGLRDANFSSVTDASYMFAYCSQLENINGSVNWNLSSLVDASCMFLKNESLVIVDALWFWRPNNLAQLGRMFDGTGIEHASFLKNWNKSSWRYIGGIVSHSKVVDLDGFQGLDLTQFVSEAYPIFSFSECPELINLNGCEDWILDPTSQIRFGYNPKLTDISAVAGWDVSHLRRLDGMFEHDEALTDLTPLSGWDVSNIQIYDDMFSWCLSLENLQPLSGWNTASALSMKSMFYACESLQYIGSLSGWNVLHVSHINNMFAKDGFAYHVADKPILDASGLNWNVPTTDIPAQGYAISPYWRCSWADISHGMDGTNMFGGTSWPNYKYSDRRRPLSLKLYPLPYWYYHNDRWIDETR